MAMARQVVVWEYEALFEKAGLKPVVVTVPSLALVNVVRRAGPAYGLLLNLEDETLTLLALAGPGWTLYRQKDVGAPGGTGADERADDHRPGGGEHPPLPRGQGAGDGSRGSGSARPSAAERPDPGRAFEGEDRPADRAGRRTRRPRPGRKPTRPSSRPSWDRSCDERHRAQPEPGHAAAPQPAALRRRPSGPWPGSSSSPAALAVFAVPEIRRRDGPAQGGPGREQRGCRPRPRARRSASTADIRQAERTSRARVDLVNGIILRKIVLLDRAPHRAREGAPGPELHHGPQPELHVRRGCRHEPAGDLAQPRGPAGLHQRPDRPRLQGHPGLRRDPERGRPAHHGDLPDL
ncbi:MAG: hypothetical protein MZV64_63285 [Ignavibacteriales bacterium]|nr:hypothetical protein [Ignavibacteriales bacterium]